MRRVFRGLLHDGRLRTLTPSWMRALARRGRWWVDYRVEHLRRAALARMGGAIPIESEYDSPFPFRLGILSDTSYYFVNHVAACRDLSVSYLVLDITASDWVNRIRESRCDAFLASPSTLRAVWHQVFDERLKVLVDELGLRLCPKYDEIWLWESKRRMREWLLAHQIPHPRTEVFLHEEQALSHLREAPLPLVLKTDSGASATGVFIIRERKTARRMVRAAFRKGIRKKYADSEGREQGFVILQDYVPHEIEWRIVRIGNDYLCRCKYRSGDFASGSGRVEWAKPTEEMLTFIEGVTNRGGFTSMGVDFFVVPTNDPQHKFLVNELQCLVGAIEHPEIRNADTGKWYREGADWCFEPGYFYQNACANLRVAHVLTTLASQRGLVLTAPVVAPPE